MGNFVEQGEADAFLDNWVDGSVKAIITSPPYTGLPGRGSTYDCVRLVAKQAYRLLQPDGSLVLIVGATDQATNLPFDVVHWLRDANLDLRHWFVWKRPPNMARDLGSVKATCDFVLQFTHPNSDAKPLHEESLLQTGALGFDYGDGVTTPPDLAAFLVAKTTDEGDLVVDPFVGLGEIGVQAVHQKRRFYGCDLDEHCAAIAQRRIDGANARVNA